jgi:hypothetical protein
MDLFQRKIVLMPKRKMLMLKLVVSGTIIRGTPKTPKLGW